MCVVCTKNAFIIHLTFFAEHSRMFEIGIRSKKKIKRYIYKIQFIKLYSISFTMLQIYALFLCIFFSKHQANFHNTHCQKKSEEKKRFTLYFQRVCFSILPTLETKYFQLLFRLIWGTKKHHHQNTKHMMFTIIIIHGADAGLFILQWFCGSVLLVSFIPSCSFFFPLSSSSHMLKIYVFFFFFAFVRAVHLG